MISTERLKQIRDRIEKASKAPWVAENKPAYATIHLDEQLNSASLRVSAPCGSQFGLIPQGVLFGPDAEFVAHARQDVPDLCDEVERLKRQNTTLAETNLSVRRKLEEVGFAPAVAEMGGCVKTGVVEQVGRLVDWSRQLENVRNCLVEELTRLNYSEEQIRVLIKE